MFVVLTAVGSTAAVAVDQDRPFVLNDRDIAVAIEADLWLDPEIDANWIDASVEDGIVTLEGAANHLHAKERATSLAESIRGVRSVINRLDLRQPLLTDRELQNKVEKALLFDAATDSYELDVTVEEGVVTLSGTVQSWAEKGIATKVAKSVPGVQGVKDEMDLEIAESRPDIEIAADVERRLEADIWVQAETIDIEVNDGVVTLDGYVGSAAEKRRAFQKAWVLGVTDVEDDGLVVDWLHRDDLRRSDVVAQLDDDTVREAVEDAHLLDPRVDHSPTVIVDRGIVTLTGTVESFQAKRSAAEDALNTRGVWRVKNYLKVRPQALISDRTLQQRVGEVLAENEFVDESDIVASVIHGTVYLRGEAASHLERQTAARIVGDLSGIVDVENRIEVDPHPQVLSDWELRQEIENQLWWSPFVDSDDILVTVVDGVATLDGTVDSRAESQAAMTNAYQAGASLVKNELEISSSSDEMGDLTGFHPLYYYYPLPM